MDAFGHVMSLVGIVFALAVTHLLTCGIALFRAGSRVKLSFTHAVWMASSLFAVLAWWLALWDFRQMASFDVGFVIFTLSGAILIYVYTGLVCPEVPTEGRLDLGKFHREHGRQYIACYFALNLLSFVYGAIYGYFYGVPEQFAQNAMLVSFLLITLAALVWRNARLTRAGQDPAATCRGGRRKHRLRRKDVFRGEIMMTARAMVLAMALVLGTAAGAQAQLAVSGNDGKQVNPADNPAGVRPDSISILDLSHYPPKRLASVAAPAGMIGPPDAVAVARDSSFALVTVPQKVNPAEPGKLIPDDTGSVVSLANPRDPKIVQTFHAGPGATGVSINRAGTMALVAATGDDSVTAFSIAHMHLTQTGKVKLAEGVSPTDVVFAPDGRTAYVSEHGVKGSKLQILNIEQGKVTDSGESIVTGRGPYGAAITPDGRYLVNTNTGGAIPPPGAEAPPRRGGTVTLVDLKTRQVLDSVEVGGISEHVALSTSGKYVEATVAIGQERGFVKVYAIEGGKLREVASAKSGNWPQGATWSKDDRTILLQCAGDRAIEVYKFDGKSLTPDPGATIRFYDRPGAIATAFSR